MFDNWWAWLFGLFGLLSIGGIGIGIWLLGAVGFLAWLSGSWLGKRIAVVVALALVVLAFIAKVFAAGQARERAKQKEASMKAMKDRLNTDNEISRLTPRERRRRLQQWTRE